MTDRPSDPERLSEISRLAGVLAERVLDAQIMSEPIQDVQIKALLDAANRASCASMTLRAASSASSRDI